MITHDSVNVTIRDPSLITLRQGYTFFLFSWLACMVIINWSNKIKGCYRIRLMLESVVTFWIAITVWLILPVNYKIRYSIQLKPLLLSSIDKKFSFKLECTCRILFQTGLHIKFLRRCCLPSLEIKNYLLIGTLIYRPLNELILKGWQLNSVNQTKYYSYIHVHMYGTSICR